MASAKIYAIRSTSGSQPTHRRLKEKATQTFLAGVPVEVEPATGFLIEWDGVTCTGVIAGISKESGSNLTTSGVPKTLTYGSVDNQPGAVKIPRGAPLNDGRCGVDLSMDDTVFFGQVKSDQTITQANVGNSYGMTKDADNHWYVDLTKNGVNAVVKIIDLGPGFGPGGSAFDARGCRFVFLGAATQNLG